MLPLGWNPAWASCLREGRAGAAAGCGLALGSVHVRGWQRPRGAPHSVFGCIKQAPRAGTPRTVCVGSVAWLCTGPGSLRPQTDPLSLSHTPGLAGALCALLCPGQGEGPCGMCPAGNTPCSGPARGLFTACPERGDGDWNPA